MESSLVLELALEEMKDAIKKIHETATQQHADTRVIAKYFARCGEITSTTKHEVAELLVDPCAVFDCPLFKEFLANDE